MKVAVIGTGYVGITTAASLGEMGHQIMGVDIDEEKIKKLQQGNLPIYEPGVEPLIHDLLRQGLLHFTTDLREAVRFADIIFIAVGTPSLPNGHADLKYVESAAAGIGQSMDCYKVIVNKSTVPIGTAERVKKIITSELNKRDLFIKFDVVSNPEFLQEGKALQDARWPDRIILGCSSENAKNLMSKLYQGVQAPKYFTSPKNAEMIKYASNAFLATKISFMNEIARLCDALGVDITEVAQGMGMDKRIGPYFLQAGIGYGGSCFPKDVAALYSMGQQAQLEMPILREAQMVNQTQCEWFVEKMKGIVSLEGKKIALLGLSFKPETDDIREAPSIKLIDLFLKNGASVSAYDPKATEPIRRIFPQITIAEDCYQVFDGADIVVLCTEWKTFQKLDWMRAKRMMKGNYLFDGRNALPAKDLTTIGFHYWGVAKKA